MTREPALGALIRELLSLRRTLFVAVVLLSIATSLAEGFGAGIVLVLFDEGRTASSALARLPGLAQVVEWTSGATLEARVQFAGVALFFVLLLRGLLYYSSGVLSHWLGEGVRLDLRRHVFDRILGRDLETLPGERAGNLVTALNHYTADAGVVARLSSRSLVSLSTILIYLLLLLLDSWQLTLLAAVLLGVSTLLTRSRFRRPQMRAGRRVNRLEAEINSFGLESMAALPLIRLHRQEERFRQRYRELAEEGEHAARRAGLLGQLDRPVFVTVNALVLCSLIIVGSRIFQSRLESWVAYLPLFLLIAMRLLGLAMVLAEFRGRIQTKAASLYSLHEILTAPAPTAAPPATKPLPFAGLDRSIDLVDVSFRYPDRELDAIHDLSLVLPRGTTTGLVGRSGAGKTTVANLVAGLLVCDQGQVLVDGLDLRELDQASWRRRVAMVAQDTFLFHDTVLENVRFGLETASEEQVLEAARMANAADFVLALPEGLHTVVGERGARLSAGQRQRLAIARAVLRDPEILILDEATSDLDSENERMVQEALQRVSRSRTVLIVAHRLSTIRQADNIVVLDGGELIEQGRHDELLEHRGLYWQLVQAQITGPGSTSR